MNKKIVLLGITIIIFLIVGLGLISNKQDSNNESNSYKLKEYNSDIVCTLDVEATEDEELILVMYIFITMKIILVKLFIKLLHILSLLVHMLI